MAYFRCTAPSGGGGGGGDGSEYLNSVNASYTASVVTNGFPQLSAYGANNCHAMFEGRHYDFNDMVVIGNNVTDCSNMFAGVWAMKSPVIIGENVENCAYMFSECQLFNNYVAIPPNVTDCTNMFNGCRSFNQIVAIPENAICTNMFRNAYSFNQPVLIKGDSTIVENMFMNCNSLNCNILFDANLTDMNGMFSGCTSLNRNNMDIGEPVNAVYTFSGCVSLSDTPSFGYELKNALGMFANSGVTSATVPMSLVNGCFMYAYTQVKSCSTIYDNCTCTARMFEGCTQFNSAVSVGAKVNDAKGMFNGCTGMSGTVKFRNNSVNVAGALKGRSNTKRILVYCNNISCLKGTTAAASIVGESISWTAMTNGFYNTKFNINIYNNY